MATSNNKLLIPADAQNNIFFENLSREDEIQKSVILY
jgi:hypothetical protein